MQAKSRLLSFTVTPSLSVASFMIVLAKYTGMAKIMAILARDKNESDHEHGLILAYHILRKCNIVTLLRNGYSAYD